MEVGEVQNCSKWRTEPEQGSAFHRPGKDAMPVGPAKSGRSQVVANSDHFFLARSAGINKTRKTEGLIYLIVLTSASASF